MLKLLAPAKINLCLDVLKKDPSGYHKIQTIFHETSQISNTIALSHSQHTDKLSIKINEKIHLINSPEHPAKKALHLLKSSFKIPYHTEIEITQNIPYSSGLGGESSTAATILKGLNQLWELNLSQEKLLNLAEQIGMDVPFFIIGGTALGINFGEKITPLKPLPKDLKIKVTPKSSPLKDKTAKAFKSLDLTRCGKNRDKTEACLKAIEEGNSQEILKNLHNDFEMLYQLNPDEHLSGSGPSTFIIDK